MLVNTGIEESPLKQGKNIGHRHRKFHPMKVGNNHDEYKSVRRHIMQEQETADPYPIYNNVFLDLGEIVFKCADATTAEATRKTFEMLLLINSILMEWSITNSRTRTASMESENFGLIICIRSRPPLLTAFKSRK
jgi:hypothetical protein